MRHSIGFFKAEYYKKSCYNEATEKAIEKANIRKPEGGYLFNKYFREEANYDTYYEYYKWCL